MNEQFHSLCQEIRKGWSIEQTDADGLRMNGVIMEEPFWSGRHWIFMVQWPQYRSKILFDPWARWGRDIGKAIVISSTDTLWTFENG